MFTALTTTDDTGVCREHWPCCCNSDHCCLHSSLKGVQHSLWMLQHLLAPGTVHYSVETTRVSKRWPWTTSLLRWRYSQGWALAYFTICLQASRSLALSLSIHLFPSFSGPWTRHPAISFLVFLFILLRTAFHTTSFWNCGVLHSWEPYYFAKFPDGPQTPTQSVQ